MRKLLSTRKKDKAEAKRIRESAMDERCKAQVVIAKEMQKHVSTTWNPATAAIIAQDVDIALTTIMQESMLKLTMAYDPETGEITVQAREAGDNQIFTSPGHIAGLLAPAQVEDAVELDEEDTYDNHEDEEDEEDEDDDDWPQQVVQDTESYRATRVVPKYAPEDEEEDSKMYTHVAKEDLPW